MPNTLGNSKGGQGVIGGIKEGSLVDKLTGERIKLKNLPGACPVKIFTEMPKELLPGTTVTCSYYSPELGGYSFL